MTHAPNLQNRPFKPRHSGISMGTQKKNEVTCELLVSHSFRLSPKNDCGELL